MIRSTQNYDLSKIFFLSIVVFLRESEFLIDNREIHTSVSNPLFSSSKVICDTQNHNLSKIFSLSIVVFLRESEFLIDNRATRNRARFSMVVARALIDLILGVAFVARNQMTGSKGAALLHPSSAIQPSRFDIRVRIATHRTRFVRCHFIDRSFLFFLSFSLSHHDSPPSILRTRVPLRD